MTSFEVIRRARKRHRCNTSSSPVCAGWIEPGQLYRRSALPPGGEMGYVGWNHMNLCAPCSARYGVPIEEAKSGD